MRRVVITGLGCVTPIGNTPEDVWQSVLQNQTGIRPLQTNFPGLKFSNVGEVRGFDASSHLSSTQIQTTERAAQFAVVAARDAAQDARVCTAYEPDRIAILTGCATAGRSAEEPEVAKLYTHNSRIHPLSVPRAMASNGASQIAIDLGITGSSLNIATACASGAHALGLALAMVRSGQADAAIAGGHEAPLTFAFLRAWDSMRVVSPTSCHPFSANRDGMTLAEGAAYLVLETLESALARGARIYAELLGTGSSTDAHHITQPVVQGPAAAMRRCLADAGLAPDQIGYINAHGTGTRANDEVESAAIHEVFGERAASIPLSSTKGLHGHAIGASGAIEAMITVMALGRGRLPATAGTQACDPGLRLDLIVGTPRQCGQTYALSNSLAFGGLNAVLAFGSVG